MLFKKNKQDNKSDFLNENESLNNDNIKLDDLIDIKPDSTKITSIKKLKKINLPAFNTKDNKINKKILFIILGVICLGLVVFGGLELYNYIVEKQISNEPAPIVYTEEELYAQNLQQELSSGYIIGVTTKDALIASGICDIETAKNDYLTKNSFTTIDNQEFLTTFLFKDNILIGVVNEAILDTNTKYNLATTFQTFISDLNKSYPEIDISKRWFTDAVKYDTDIWNDMIVNNQLELICEMAKDTEFVKVIASGVPYFDYLANNRHDQSFGNLVIIYSNGINQEVFKDIDNISTK